MAKLEKNTVSFITKNELEYYSGDQRYGDSHIKRSHKEMLIIQKSVCASLNRRLNFK
jgi:hypothetical protein